MLDTIGNRTGILVRMVIISLKDGNPVPTNCFVFPPVRMDVLLRHSSVDYNKSNSLQGQIKTVIKTASSHFYLPVYCRKFEKAYSTGWNKKIYISIYIYLNGSVISKTGRLGGLTQSVSQQASDSF